MCFDRTVSFTLPRGSVTRRGSVCAQVVDDGFMDSFDETKADTQIREITVFVRRSAWTQFANEVPRIGDTVETLGRERFKIVSVSDLGGMIYSMKARQC